MFVTFLGGGYLKVRAQTPAGIVRDFGHPVLDNLLLFPSGILLAALLALGLYLVRSGHSHPVEQRLVAYPLLILAGSLMTWLCNRVLRRQSKG